MEHISRRTTRDVDLLLGSHRPDGARRAHGRPASPRWRRIWRSTSAGQLLIVNRVDGELRRAAGRDRRLGLEVAGVDPGR